MKITRFYAAASGESRFQEVEVPIDQPKRDGDGNTYHFSKPYASPGVMFVELPEGLVQTWHHAPARQIVVVVSGVLEVGTSDGQKRQWRTGETFIADDLTGKGHTTRVLEGPARLVFTHLPESFDFGRWSA